MSYSGSRFPVSMAVVAFNRKIAREIDAKITHHRTNNTSFNTLTEQQGAVVHWARHGRGSATVVARAGTGKTHLLCAVVQELNVRPRTGTFHSFGWNQIRRSYPKAQIEGTRPDSAGYYKFDRILREIEGGIPSYMQGFVKSCLSHAKLAGFGPLKSMSDRAAWHQMIAHHGLDYQLANAMEENGVEHDFDDALEMGIDGTFQALKLSNDMAHEVVDFDDMLYIPLAANLRMWQNDWLLVDEAQDTNATRRALIRKMLKPGGRLIAVGDDKQAIYGFTGADNDSLDQISRGFGCTKFPLTVTFRCPKAVVAEAQRFVADFQAHEGNKEGTVSNLTQAEFYRQKFVPGEDVVLCRNTKPLVEVAFALIKQQIPCHVEGKDIGQDIMKLVRRFRDAKNLEQLEDQLIEYRDTEVQKFMAAGKESVAESLNDRIETVLVLMQGLPANGTVAHLQARVESMFADTPDGEKPKRVVCMTLHRSKGLEFPRVFFLGRYKFCPSPFARQEWQIEQEDNLIYVGITRSEKELYYVDA